MRRNELTFFANSKARIDDISQWYGFFGDEKHSISTNFGKEKNIAKE